MARSIIILLALLSLSGNIFAQDSNKEDFRKEQERLRREYRKQRDSLVADYEHFRDSCNAAYAKFLAEEWASFQVHKGVAAPKEEMRLPDEVLEQMKHPTQSRVSRQAANAAAPAFNVRGVVASARDFFKRLQPPQALVRERSSEWTRRGHGKNRKRRNPADSQTVHLEPEADQQVLHEVEAPENLLSFDYYGTAMQVDIGDLPDRLRLPRLVEDSVASAWTLCSRKNYMGLIQDCLSLKKEHCLGDWAYLQMLLTLSEKAFGKGTNESIFLTAYIYSQSGYRIRLGRDGNHLLMLYATHHQIYGECYMSSGNQDFYLLPQSDHLDYIRACDNAISAQEQPLSLWMKEPIRLDDTSAGTKTIQSDKYPDIRMEVRVNENLIRYYNDYPNSQLGADVLTRWAIYADTPMNEDVRQQIYPALQKQLDCLTGDDEKVCRLLSLIQPRDTTFGVNPWQSLVYDYDEIRWGRDRAFFPEETLYYPYSDCEDHAILFSRLVRDLLGLKVLLVYYNKPGSQGEHLATAVHFSKPPSMGSGDALIYNGERYYVCDPTNYIPEPGVTMAGMDNSTAQVILLNEQVSE